MGVSYIPEKNTRTQTTYLIFRWNHLASIFAFRNETNSDTIHAMAFIGRRVAKTFITEDMAQMPIDIVYVI